MLVRLMSGLKSISASNADNEKGFSMLRKVHTDQRPAFQQMYNLMAIKFNSEECCHNTIFNEELLTMCKKQLYFIDKKYNSKKATLLHNKI